MLVILRSRSVWEAFDNERARSSDLSAQGVTALTLGYRFPAEGLLERNLLSC